MGYLIDTNAFIWYVTGDAQLSQKAKEVIESYEARYISLASIWEMAIKTNIGKLTFQKPFEKFIRYQIELNNFELLPIKLEHLFSFSNLPLHHRDPFDRLLVAQCLQENITLLSADVAFDAYSITRVWK
jgi:PIN domain nuclease of toxin-antitoxin system